MQSLGAADLLVLLVFVALVLDSRRVRALARTAGWGRRDPVQGQGIPPGGNPERVGLTLRQIQMRHHVDWLDGGVGREGPEILPGDDMEFEAEAQPNRALPVLWRPFRALTAAGA